ncbi:MAG: hypothetical protein IT583_07305 [Verrucomicrobia bacterium]|nr:hypothetical protein [Verrucomicrobiota bacterium]
MREFIKLPLGCLAVILIAVAVWVAVNFIFIPAADQDVRRDGHTLKDYTDRLFHGR